MCRWAHSCQTLLRSQRRVCLLAPSWTSALTTTPPSSPHPRGCLGKRSTCGSCGTSEPTTLRRGATSPPPPPPPKKRFASKTLLRSRTLHEGLGLMSLSVRFGTFLTLSDSARYRRGSKTQLAQVDATRCGKHAAYVAAYQALEELERGQDCHESLARQSAGPAGSLAAPPRT
eukprot:6285488-Amphidinium_carterae.1